jgi:phytoene dehydrogenase-like protein
LAYLEFVETLDALLTIGLPFVASDPKHPGARTLLAGSRAAVRHRRRLGAVIELVTGSGDLAVRERFRHPIVQAALLNLAAAAGPITADGTGITHLVLAYVHRFGCGRAVGGTQAIPDAVAACLAAAGGRVMTAAPVERITIEGDRATGVELTDGRRVSARRAVLAACDPRTALGRLLPPGALGDRMAARVAAIPVNAGGTSPMTVNVALSGRLALRRHTAWRGDGVDLRIPITLIGTPEDIDHSYRTAAAGGVSEQSFLWGAVPTAVDPGQAPDGQDVYYAYAPAAPIAPADPGPAGAEQAAKVILTRSAAFYDHLPELELGRFVELPADIAARTRSTNGSILHVDFALLRSGPLRPARGFGGYETPVAGLFITGAGSHPGAGVSGEPGRLAARRILATLGR